MRIKICGITRPEDARTAEREGADAIGVVLFSDASPRSVSVERARKVFDAVGPFTATIAVTHTTSIENLEEILSLGPTAIQISHPFRPDATRGKHVIRMIARGDTLPDDCAAVVVDESRGGGRHFNLPFARHVVQRSKIPVILAGGLTPGNVKEAIRAVQPYAVDVATGVERAPGIKDAEKIRAFIAAVRSV